MMEMIVESSHWMSRAGANQLERFPANPAGNPCQKMSDERLLRLVRVLSILTFSHELRTIEGAEGR